MTTDFDKACVQTYLTMSRSLHGLLSRPPTQWPASVLVPALRRARLFGIPTSVWPQLYQDADVYTQRNLIGLPYEPYTADEGEESKLSMKGEEALRYVTVIEQHGRELPFPEPLPFEAVCFVYGLGVQLSPAGVTLRFSSRKAEQEQLDDVRLLAHVIDSVSSTVWELVAPHVDDKISNIYVYEVYSSATRWQDDDGRLQRGCWDRCSTLTPWALNALVKLVDTHKTALVKASSLSFKRAYQSAQKTFGIPPELRRLPPPAYYPVPLQNEVVVERSKEYFRGLHVRATVQFSHRWDVRGHERCRIARGRLPLAPETREKFADLGYTVFTSTPCDAETIRRLSERGQPNKQPTEWLAIKTAWVKPHVRGPEDAPHIPSMHTLTEPR